MTSIIHGGPDALGVPIFDFSTNANACGPCPMALQQVRAADHSRYPDPHYHALRAQLAAWHGVAPWQVLPAASASEAIQRITACAWRNQITQLRLPPYSYGDYARAGAVWGMQRAVAPERPALHWLCEPASPGGGPDAALLQGSAHPQDWRVLDCAYRPLQLHGLPRPIPADMWQLWTPNKALGLTGVRAAYLLAPEHAQAQVDVLQAMSPSWPWGADAVALLTAWTQPATQAWLAQSRQQLLQWKSAQMAWCQRWGWEVWPDSLANYFCTRPVGCLVEPLSSTTQQLRQHGIKLRDTASFGLPGWVRLGVLPPAAHRALANVSSTVFSQHRYPSV